MRGTTSSLVESGVWLLSALLFWPLVNNIWEMKFEREHWFLIIAVKRNGRRKCFSCANIFTQERLFSQYICYPIEIVSHGHIPFQFRFTLFMYLTQLFFIKMLFRLLVPLTWCAFLYGISCMNISRMFLCSLWPITFPLFYFVSLLRHFLSF